MTAQLARLGLEAARVPAIDAKSDLAAMQARRSFPAPQDGVIFACNSEGRRYFLGEEACFQSHLKALDAFLSSGAETALILEDDAELAPDMPALLDAMAREADLWDGVRLESVGRRGARRALKIAALPGGRMLVASLRPCSGASGYLVTRKGAERLIAAADGLFVPFDTYLSSMGRHGLSFLDCAPSPVRQTGASSMIHEARDAGAAVPKGRASGLKARWRRLRADLARVTPRRRVFPRRYAGRNQGWVEAPWNRPW